MRSHLSTNQPASPRHNPGSASNARLKRAKLIDDVSTELKRRHGGNDVLNQLEAEILVDHFLEDRREERKQDESYRAFRAADVIRHARLESPV